MKDYFIIVDGRTVVIIERPSSYTLKELALYMCENGLRKVNFSRGVSATKFGYPDKKADVIVSGIDKDTKSVKVDLKIDDSYYSTYFVPFDIACNIM